MPSGIRGAKVWYIPDAYLPGQGQGQKYEGHESVCILNESDNDARIRFALYFEDKEPIAGIEMIVPARRCKHVGMHRPEQLGGAVIPRETPYAIKIFSDIEITVQYTRLDVAQQNLALMTIIPYSSPD